LTEIFCNIINVFTVTFEIKLNFLKVVYFELIIR